MSEDELTVQKTSAQKVKSLLWGVVRAGVGFGLAFFFIYKMLGEKFSDQKEEMLATLQSASIPWLIFAVVVFGAVLFTTFWRWKLLLEVQGINLPFLTASRLGLIGTFFNLCMPGAVSGDVVKMAYISRHAGKKTTEAVLTIMLDRVLGLFGLLIVAAVACLANLDYLMAAGEKVQLATGFVGAVSLCSFFGIAVVVLRERLQRLPGVAGILAFADRKLPEPVTSRFKRLVWALDLYKKHIKTLWAVLLSIFVHCMNATLLISVAKAIGAKVSISHYFLTIQVSNAISSVPLLPGGLGLRDYITAVFLQDGGATEIQAKLIPILFTCVFASWYIFVGGSVFIFSRFGKAENEENEGGPSISSDADSANGS